MRCFAIVSCRATAARLRTVQAVCPGSPSPRLALAAGWIAGGLGEPLARNPVLVAMLFGLLIGNSFAAPKGCGPASISPSATCCGWPWCWSAFASPCGCSSISARARLRWPRSSWSRAGCAALFRGAARVQARPRARLAIAAGSAVCGAAAILSVAALTRARDQNAGIAIALITLTGTVALLLYPVAFIGGWLPGLDDRLYGVFVGASIYELAQVYGASFAISEGALNTATLVKLSKVLMLVPLLLVLGLSGAAATRSIDARRRSVPWFIVAFVGVMLLNSAFTLHPRRAASSSSSISSCF